MNKPEFEIEINEHIYQWRNGCLYVQPYSKWLDVYTEVEVVRDCELSEAEKWALSDSRFRVDPIRKKERSR